MCVTALSISSPTLGSTMVIRTRAETLLDWACDEVQYGFTSLLIPFLLEAFRSTLEIMAPLARKALLALFASASVAPSVNAITESDVQAAYGTLMSYYNESIGLWIPSTGYILTCKLSFTQSD